MRKLQLLIYHFTEKFAIGAGIIDGGDDLKAESIGCGIGWMWDGCL